MAIQRKPYFYDAQIKRLLVQLMATFAGYQVRTGKQRDGNHHFIDVPLIYADAQKTVGYIIAGSENYLASLPVMSIYMTSLQRKRDWVHTPQHYEKYQFWERARDPDGNLIVNQPGQRKIIERYMPVPYDLKIDLAMWASNNDQLYQLVEQVTSVFNPEQEIQLSNSPADWSFLTTLWHDGDVRFEKAIPEGTSPDPLYVATMPFTTVIWMSVPAKVYDAQLISTIKFAIKDINDDLDFDAMPELDSVIMRPPQDSTVYPGNI